MVENHQDQGFLELLVKSIVSHPENVVVDRTVDERGVLLTLKIDPADMGYVIGRKGQTAQAIRTLLKIIGAKNNARVNLKIFEPEGSTRAPRENREERPEEKHEDIDSSMDLGDIDATSVDDLNI